MEGDDVRMPERLEDVNLSVEILFELLVQLPEVDGFDGYCGIGCLYRVVSSAAVEVAFES